MDKETALKLFEALEQPLAWTQAEYEKGVQEAEAEGEEPLLNPHLFDVRLDSRGNERSYEQHYRVRVTAGPGGEFSGFDWQIVFDIAREHGVRADLQNNGIELS